jgi:small subunit ribosomal protein S8
MTNYSIGDYLIRIKNAAMAGRKETSTPATKANLALAQVLKKLGYLAGVSTKDESASGGKKWKENIICTLAFKHKKAVLMGLKLISKPGLRVYMGVSEIENRKKPSTLILSTPKGIISSLEAKKERIGGEVIAEVW